MIKNRMNEVKSMTIRKDLYEMNVDHFPDELRRYISVRPSDVLLAGFSAVAAFYLASLLEFDDHTFVRVQAEDAEGEAKREEVLQVHRTGHFALHQVHADQAEVFSGKMARGLEHGSDLAARRAARVQRNQHQTVS